MKFIRTIFFVVVIGMMCSCKHQNLKCDKPYFDFDSLANVQVKKLNEAKETVSKKTFLNNENDSTAFIPNEEQWKNELNELVQLDIINKPSFKGAYHFADTKDEHSNLQVRTYSTTKKSPVAWVKFYFLNDFKNLKKIESIYHEENTMVSSQKKLLVDFDDSLQIKHYHIQGFQKMILNDSVKFSVDGKIQHNAEKK